MKTPITNSNHAKLFNLNGLLIILFCLACIPATVSLSGCAGYTSAKQTQPGSDTGTLTARPASLAFGSVSVGSNSAQSLTITNTGTSTVNIASAAVTGTGFSITGGSPSSALPAGQSSTIQIQFAPQSAGSASGSFSVASDASNSELTVALTGTGAAPGLGSSPSSVNLGGVRVGSTGSATITLTNSGTASVTISAASASGTGFSINGLSTPLTLNPGQSAPFTAKFAPSASGAASGSISITSNSPSSPLTIPLSGTGTQAAIAATPSSASFGSVATGSRNSQTISLKNAGTASLTISQASVSGTGFSISGLSVPAIISSGKSATFNIVFAPTAAGAVSGSVKLTSDAPNSPLSIPVSGTGVTTTHLLGINPGSVSFGNVNVGSRGSSTVKLTNNGNSNITISSVQISGGGFGESGVSSGLTLTPSQSASLNVTFAPTAGGNASGTVTVTSNATNSPANIGLSGSGVKAVAHSVNLGWDASTSQGVVGYYVYRSLASGSFSAPLNSSPVAPSQFTDSGVQSGQTYFYVVTSVDGSGVQSVFSSQVTAKIPTP